MSYPDGTDILQLWEDEVKKLATGYGPKIPELNFENAFRMYRLVSQIRREYHPWEPVLVLPMVAICDACRTGRYTPRSPDIDPKTWKKGYISLGMPMSEIKKAGKCVMGGSWEGPSCTTAVWSWRCVETNHFMLSDPHCRSISGYLGKPTKQVGMYHSG